MTTETLNAPRPRTALNVALWTVQGLLALFFVYAGYTKLATPLDQLAKTMPWTAEHPGLVALTGVVDLLGGLGILLPALFRIQPRLTILAGWGLFALQITAMLFHLARGETMVAPLNVVLIALVLFVVWGRTRAVPFAAARTPAR